MDPETYNALQASIRHWEENKNAKTPEEVNVSANECALCLRFVLATGRCAGCPIKEATELAECEGTPYYEARDKLMRWNTGYNTAQTPFKKYAEEMENLLRALIPAGGPTNADV